MTREGAEKTALGGKAVGETAVGCDMKCRMLATLGTRMRLGYRSGWRALGDRPQDYMEKEPRKP